MVPIAVALGVAAAIFGLVCLPRYGITFDEPALFYSGDRTLFWLGHRDVPGALDFLSRVEPPGFHTAFERWPLWEDAVHYPILAAFVSSLASFFFHDLLGAMGVVDGHQAGLVLLHAASLAGFCIYASKLLGKEAGILAAVFLALFPCALGHSFNNAKDWPCAQIYGLSILAFGVGVIEKKPRHVVVASVLCGLALACKLNGAFIFPTLMAWLPFAYGLLYWRRGRVAPILAAVLLGPYLAVSIFLLTWPWLMHGGAAESWKHGSDYIAYYIANGGSTRPGWTIVPLKCVVFMTPPLVLACALFQLVVGWRNGPKATAMLLLLVIWIGLPILRVAVPKSRFYDANRHFIEYVPALCCIAGAGASRILALLRRVSTSAFAKVGPRSEHVASALVGLIGLVTLLVPIIQYHPFESAYFNFMAGGLGGAQHDGLLAQRMRDETGTAGTEGDYWFSSLRDGMKDLAAVTKDGDPIAVCAAGWGQVRPNLPEGRTFEILASEDVRADAAFLYLSPRELTCKWKRVRELERSRPVVKRVERDGGLIYEILGPRGGALHEPVSGENWYTRNEAWAFK